MEAAYEATMLAAVLNKQRGASSVVLGNEAEWISAAIRRTLAMMSSSGLDERSVSYGTPSREILRIAKDVAMLTLVSDLPGSRLMCQWRSPDVPLSSLCRRSRLSAMDPNAVMQRIPVPSFFHETRSGYENPACLSNSLATNRHVLVDRRRLCSEPPECFHLVRTSLQNLLHHFKRPYRVGHTLH